MVKLLVDFSYFSICAQDTGYSKNTYTKNRKFILQFDYSYSLNKNCFKSGYKIRSNCFVQIQKVLFHFSYFFQWNAYNSWLFFGILRPLNSLWTFTCFISSTWFDFNVLILICAHCTYGSRIKKNIRGVSSKGREVEKLLYGSVKTNVNLRKGILLT